MSRKSLLCPEPGRGKLPTRGPVQQRERANPGLVVALTRSADIGMIERAVPTVPTVSAAGCRGGEPHEGSNPEQSESQPSTELPNGLPRYPGALIDHDHPEHVANDGVENPNLGRRGEPPNTAGFRDLFDQDPGMRSKGGGSQKL